MSSCILYQNSSATIILLDIPRSLELAQGCSSPQSSRLISSKPLEHPYPSVEPKSAKSKAKLGPASVEDLLLQKHLEFALDELTEVHKGIWCQTRVTVENWEGASMNERKRPIIDVVDTEEPPAETAKRQPQVDLHHVILPRLVGDTIFYYNSDQASLHTTRGPEKSVVRIPPKSTVLQGDIAETLSIFKDSAPKFDLIVLDPPWPNRSARRKQSYSISYGTSEVHSLLSSLPLYDHLANDGLVTVWTTNKPALRELLLGEGGLFEEWGVHLIEEWIWLKITSHGKPICALDSTWRKPYEVLLVGRRGGEKDGHVRRRVVVGVPDLHSRKPNLKVLYEGLMAKKEGSYEGLEIFARNLTTGWWSWGNEVLNFQTADYWADL
jgi:N6-adenosine-specific RNA methylase IME4